MAGALFAAISGCTKPTLIGADLFQGPGFNLTFTDTVAINAYSEKPDSVVTFNSGWSTTATGDAHYGSMLLGCFKDPTFGVSKATIFTQLSPINSFNYAANATIIDSAFIYLPYNPVYVYGDTMQPVTINIYRMTEDFRNSPVQYSSKNYATETKPLVSYTFMPTPNIVNRDYTYNTSVATPDTTKPHILIKFTGADLTNIIGILRDSALYAHLSDSASFFSAFKGLAFRMDTKGNNSLLSFVVDSARLMVFHDSSGRFDYTMALGGNGAIGSNYFTHDYSGTVIPQYLRTKASDRLFLQDMAGPTIRMEIPNANLLGKLSTTGKIAVNKAELNFTIDDSDGIDPIDQIFVYKQATDGSLTAVADAALALSSYGTYGNYALFGGSVTRDTLDNGVTIKKKYKMNITYHFQKMIEGVEGPTFYILPLYKAQKGQRAAIYGPTYAKDPRFRAKLNLTYTKL